MTVFRLNYPYLGIPDFTICAIFTLYSSIETAILEVRFGPYWMTENHFRSHFSPLQMNTQLFFLKFVSQNGCWQPFWMTENHFRSHFSPFQINTQLWFFPHKMAAGGHFFDHISRHFRSIRNFYFLNCFHKMAAAAILDDRKSLANAFLAISDQYATFFFWIYFSFWKSLWGHFGWPKITFDLISRHFRLIHNFFLNFFFKIFLKMAARSLGSPICAKNNRVLPLCVINAIWLC